MVGDVEEFEYVEEDLEESIEEKENRRVREIVEKHMSESRKRIEEKVKEYRAWAEKMGISNLIPFSSLLLDLPEYILIYIFMMLPSVDIIKVRCVNKLFYQLTSTDEFIRDYTKFIASKAKDTTYRLLVNLKGPVIQFLVYSDHNYVLSDKIALIGSCNDLIWTTILDNGCLLLLHPCIPIRKLLRPLDPTVYGPGYVHTTYGFGYDAATDDYKVVAFCLYNNWIHIGTGWTHQYYSIVLVCSSKRNSWRRVDDDYFLGGIVNEHSSCFASGNIHWITDPNYCNGMRRDIVCFDVEKERIQVVEEPDYGTNYALKYHSKTLSVLDGCLSLMCRDICVPESELWVMKEHGVKDSWTTVRTIPQSYPMRFSSMLPDDKILFADEDSNSFLTCGRVQNEVWKHRIFHGGIPIHSYSASV